MGTHFFIHSVVVIADCIISRTCKHPGEHRDKGMCVGRTLFISPDSFLGKEIRICPGKTCRPVFIMYINNHFIVCTFLYCIMHPGCNFLCPYLHKPEFDPRHTPFTEDGQYLIQLPFKGSAVYIKKNFNIL